MDTATHLATIRAKLGRLSQEEFATLIGRSRYSVSGWECGQNAPQLDTIAQALYPLGVSTEYVLGLSDVYLRHGYTEAQVRANVANALVDAASNASVSSSGPQQ